MSGLKCMEEQTVYCQLTLALTVPDFIQIGSLSAELWPNA